MSWMGFLPSRTGAGGGGGSGSEPNLSGASLDVTAGSFAGGDLITVTGASGIDRGAVLTIDGVDVPVMTLDDVDGYGATSFVFVTPRRTPSAAGAKSITAENPNGQSASKASAFTYLTSAIIPTFISMTALAAAMTAVGDFARLIGGTLGTQVAMVERVSAGARGCVWRGELRLDRADGTELDGAFAPTALGAAASPTWGGSGARGLILPAGTITLPGWAYQSSVRAALSAKIEGWAYPSVPAAHDNLSAGLIRDTSGVVSIGGGVAYNGTTVLRAALVNAGTLDLPTGAYATVGVTTTAGSPFICGVSAMRVLAAGQVAYHAGFTDGGTDTGGVGSSSTSLWGAATDLQPSFTRRGNWGAGARVTALALLRNLI